MNIHIHVFSQHMSLSVLVVKLLVIGYVYFYKKLLVFQNVYIILHAH